MKPSQPKFKPVTITKFQHTESTSADDSVATEEPMEIRLVYGPSDQRAMRSLSVTMRTPGNDAELAAGFLFSEGILNCPTQIESTEFRGVDETGRPTDNIVRVNLQPDVQVDFKQLQRNFFTTSSCGVCGKASLESLEVKGIEPLDPSSFRVPASSILMMPDALRKSQPTFDQTGGIHAACFADDKANVLETHEDIGRHNAVDKLIGDWFLANRLPAVDVCMVVSGRASFEIVQKAIVAGVPVMVAVGAPSSLAVELAQRFQMTLVGFANSSRFNVYSNPERIA
jgi:FdhD protein